MIIKLICTNNNTRLILSQSKFAKSSKGVSKFSPHSIIKSSGLGPQTIIKAEPLLFQYTTGMLGFKGATRSSTYAAENLFKKFITRLINAKLYTQSYVVLVKGLGPARNYLLRKLAQLKITEIKDITAFPYNGCRKKKSRSY
jgi:ribosomal protein S11